MKLLVLGSSGACGRWLVRLAVERGHEVTAVVRPESRFDVPESVRFVSGSVLDSDFLTPLLGDHDVVLSCLGLRRASILPWSRLLSPPDLVQRVSETVAAASTHASFRYIWISAGGVGDSIRRTTVPVRWVIRAGNVGTAYRDLEQAECVLAHVPSLSVRPVTLVNGEARREAGPVARYGIFSTIRRSAVARWMIDVADGTQEYPHRTVLLGTP